MPRRAPTSPWRPGARPIRLPTPGTVPTPTNPVGVWVRTPRGFAINPWMRAVVELAGYLPIPVPGSAPNWNWARWRGASRLEHACNPAKRLTHLDTVLRSFNACPHPNHNTGHPNGIPCLTAQAPGTTTPSHTVWWVQHRYTIGGSTIRADEVAHYNRPGGGAPAANAGRKAYMQPIVGWWPNLAPQPAIAPGILGPQPVPTPRDAIANSPILGPYVRPDLPGRHGGNDIQKLKPRLGAAIRIVPGQKTVEAVRPREREKPKPREKERKKRMGGTAFRLLRALLYVAGVATEANDWVTAMWNALPKASRRLAFVKNGYRPLTGAQRANWVAKNIDDVDMGAALHEIAEMLGEDFLYGAGGDRVGRWYGDMTGGVVGPETGPMHEGINNAIAEWYNDQTGSWPESPIDAILEYLEDPDSPLWQ